MSPNRRIRVAGHRLVFALLVVCGSNFAVGADVENFCFLQVTDMHVGPYAKTNPEPGKSDRSVREIAWFCEQAQQPQPLTPEGGRTPEPSFVIATGDLTEYGVIHNTWDHFEAFFKPLDIPLYCSPGNHDNTWTNMQSIMRKRHGGDHYSFDRFGCHFISINTATPQEPVPSLEQRTLTWIASDLRNVSPETPVFIFCHHPMSSREFSYPIEQLRLLDVIEEHNVVLLLMGHGHSSRHERWATLDSVMGGTTYNPRPNNLRAGYSIISVVDGVLRVAYQHQDPGRGLKLVLEKPIAPFQKPTLELVEPPAQTWHGRKGILANQPQIKVKIRVSGGVSDHVTATLDNKDDRAFKLVGNPAGDVHQGTVSTENLGAGWHYLRLQGKVGEYELDEAVPLLVPARPELNVEGLCLDAGIKAAPLLVDENRIIVATTAGTLESIDFSGDKPQREFLLETQAEILHQPALLDGHLYVSASEKGVYCIGLDGKLHWQCNLGEPVIGTPAVGMQHVYVGDLEGNVHAIDRTTGEVKWSTHHATFSIEQPLVLHDGVLYFGAWDGFVYAVNAEDGSRKWKTRGPAGQLTERKYKSRYYGPADCSPLVLGERLFVCDRAYRLGEYNLDGDYIRELATGVSAISPSADGKRFYARGSSEGLACYDANGERLWSNPVELGRFPAPAAASRNCVFACSNRGRVSCHDEPTGVTKWSYKTTPDLHVMAPVAASSNGSVFVAGMDGSVTRMSAR